MYSGELDTVDVLVWMTEQTEGSHIEAVSDEILAMLIRCRHLQYNDEAMDIALLFLEITIVIATMHYNVDHYYWLLQFLLQEAR